MEDTHTHRYFNTKNKTVLVLRLSKEDLEDMIDMNSNNDNEVNAEKVIGIIYWLVRINAEGLEMLVYVDGDVEVDDMGDIQVDGSVTVFRDKEEMYFVLGSLHKSKNQIIYVEDEGNLPSENILKLLEVDEDSK